MRSSHMACVGTVLILAAAVSAAAEVKEEDICPASCRKPNCDHGAAWNGHTCSRKFGEVRYCGSGSKYELGDSVNCSGCKTRDLDDEEKVHAAELKQASANSIREALLQEAKERLTTWYSDKEALNLPYWSYQVEVQQTKQWYLCDKKGGSMRVPVTFGEFNVTGASPVNVFNAVADVAKQTKWDSTVDEVNVLGDYREDGVRGVEMLLPSGIWLVPPREVYQWEAYNGSLESEEFWFVVSTSNVEPLHEVRHINREAVQANNCLGAYWIRPCPKGGEANCPAGNPTNCCPAGGSRVIFSSHVNVHPPALITAKSIFDMSWPKQVEWINALKKQAVLLNKSANVFALNESSVELPAWLWQDPAEPPSSGSGANFSFPRRIIASPNYVTQFYGLQQLRGSFVRSWWSSGFVYLACVAAVLLGIAGWRRRSRRPYLEVSCDDERCERCWSPGSAGSQTVLLAA
eukprot:TRINITY_DN11114_c0_g1_i2.p1 TRINITY_DN11114_c0_g1~~TRINITY_DN11114_c0_g1_i2.p1  ORF type:complete len:470 (+),score=108.47 TRINITY_DN11114_c0_g1_i2:28-1410(+)